jgi:hypothetical protein
LKPCRCYLAKVETLDVTVSIFALVAKLAGLLFEFALVLRGFGLNGKLFDFKSALHYVEPCVV